MRSSQRVTLCLELVNHIPDGNISSLKLHENFVKINVYDAGILKTSYLSTDVISWYSESRKTIPLNDKSWPGSQCGALHNGAWLPVLHTPLAGCNRALWMQTGTPSTMRNIYSKNVSKKPLFFKRKTLHAFLPATEINGKIKIWLITVYKL